MDLHRTFPIGNLDSVFTDLLFLVGVTYRVFFLILFSLKKNKNKWQLLNRFKKKKRFFKNTKNESRLLSGKRIIGKMQGPQISDSVGDCFRGLSLNTS